MPPKKNKHSTRKSKKTKTKKVAMFAPSPTASDAPLARLRKASSSRARFTAGDHTAARYVDAAAPSAGSYDYEFVAKKSSRASSSASFVDDEGADDDGSDRDSGVLLGAPDEAPASALFQDVRAVLNHYHDASSAVKKACEYANTSGADTAIVANLDDLADSLPDIIVVGSQTTGKSSILSMISGVPLLVRRGMGNTAPIHLHTRNVNDGDAEHGDGDWRAEIHVAVRAAGDGHRIVPPELLRVHSFDASNRDEIPQLIDMLQQQISAVEGKQYSANHSIVIKVFSEDVPSLNLVDFPGLTNEPGEQRAIEEMIKKSPESSIVLNAREAIVEASKTHDRNIMTYLRGRRADRILTVVTKTDQITTQRVAPDLDPRVWEQGHQGMGIVYTTAKPEGNVGGDADTPELESGMNNVERRQRERYYLTGEAPDGVDTTGWPVGRGRVGLLSRLRSDQLGVEALCERLQRRLMHGIGECISRAEVDLDHARSDLEKYSERLPDANVSPRSQFDEAYDAFRGRCNKLIEHSGNNHPEAKKFYKTVRELFSDWAQALRQRAPAFGTADDCGYWHRLKDELAGHGCEVAADGSEVAKYILPYAQEQWPGFCAHLIKSSETALITFLGAEAERAFGQFPRCLQRVRACLEDTVSAAVEECAVYLETTLLVLSKDFREGDTSISPETVTELQPQIHALVEPVLAQSRKELSDVLPNLWFRTPHEKQECMRKVLMQGRSVVEDTPEARNQLVNMIFNTLREFPSVREMISLHSAWFRTLRVCRELVPRTIREMLFNTVADQLNLPREVPIPRGLQHTFKSTVKRRVRLHNMVFGSSDDDEIRDLMAPSDDVALHRHSTTRALEELTTAMRSFQEIRRLRHDVRRRS